MSVPAIYDACTANPDVRFHMLTKPHPARLFVNPPENLTLLPVDFSRYDGPAGLWRLASELTCNNDIDCYVDLHNVLRTRLLRIFMRLRGIPVFRIDKDRREKRSLCRNAGKILVPLKPNAERYRDTFRKAGIPLVDSFVTIFGDRRPEVPKGIKPKTDGERWIAIAPFAAHTGKIYPLSLMKRVVDDLAADPDNRIFIMGAGDEERRKIADLAEGRGNIFSTAEMNLGLGGELALLAHCDVMLSMDSANMHLASLVRLRTVSIWGATHPFAGFLGIGQKMSDTVQLDMTCRPCSVYGNRPCGRGDYHCLNGIPPEMVTARIKAILTAETGRGDTTIPANGNRLTANKMQIPLFSI